MTKLASISSARRRQPLRVMVLSSRSRSLRSSWVSTWSIALYPGSVSSAARIASAIRAPKRPSTGAVTAIGATSTVASLLWASSIRGVAAKHKTATKADDNGKTLRTLFTSSPSCGAGFYSSIRDSPPSRPRRESWSLDPYAGKMSWRKVISTRLRSGYATFSDGSQPVFGREELGLAHRGPWRRGRSRRGAPSTRVRPRPPRPGPP